MLCDQNRRTSHKYIIHCRDSLVMGPLLNRFWAGRSRENASSGPEWAQSRYVNISEMMGECVVQVHSKCEFSSQTTLS